MNKLKEWFNNNRTSVGWGGLALFSLVFLFARVMMPDKGWLHTTLLVVIALFLALVIKENYRSLKTRSAAYGIQSFITIVLILSIVGVFNFVSSKHPFKWDSTSKKIHTLSDQSKKIVKKLTTKVDAKLFSTLGEREKFRPLLENYQAQSTQFKVLYLDPYKSPTLIQKLDIKKNNTLHIQVGEKSKKIEEVTEEKITNALIELQREKKQTLCTIAGHGEKDFDSQEADGYMGIKKGLEAQAYDLKVVNLPQEGKIPADCDMVAVIGPNKSFFKPEIKVISDYIEKGGRGLFAIDLDLRGGELAPEIIQLLGKWYVTAGKALIVDPLSRMLGVDAAVPIVATFSRDHNITKEFKSNCFFPFSRPLEIKKGAPPSLKVNWLAKTTPKSWGERSLKDIGKKPVKMDPGKDATGPLITAVAVEGSLKKATKKETSQDNSRLVVFSTSQFANNNYSRFGKNIDLFLNAVSWLMEDENLISIRAKKDNPGKVNLDPQQLILVFWVVVVLFPLAIAGIGGVTWYRRRKL